MRNYFLIFIIISFFIGCSQSANNFRARRGTPPKKYPIAEKIDSTNLKAAVKPYGYRWNEEGNLADIPRKKYKPLKIDRKYPNPISPPTFINFTIEKSDTIKFFICNENESSCYKFEEDYFTKGSYSLGFQKLDFDTTLFIFKAEAANDVFFKMKYLYIP
ncbi:MAG: hypothetical protein QY331_01270 [Melioribacteraceae bacterium]|nr:MAG: hypothetical protein QY331_01270 [Melioribacteraceae bacterium]